MDKKLKVLMVGLLPTDISKVDGGVVAVILNLLSGFSKMDRIEMIFLSFNMEIKEECVKQYSSNIRIIYLPYKIPFKFLDYFINRKRLNEIVEQEKIDIIHIQESDPHLFRFIGFPKKNIIVTQHGINKGEFKYATGIKSKLKFFFKMYVEDYIFPMFKNVIFISNYNKALYPNRKVVSEKIYNPVNPIFFEHQEIKGDLNSISYVARINNNKNLSLVLNALSILKKENIIFKLHVVGGYKDDYYEGVINSIVEENNLADQVIFYGWQTQEQILKVHEKCRIFVLPSQQETMPVVIGEAMALGKVVVASNVGAISEMLVDKHSGFLFESNKLDELCNLFRQLYNNSELIDSVSRNAMSEARDKFNPDSIVSKTYEFYLKVRQNTQSNE